MIRLYSNPHSPFCRKVKVVLEEKSLPYEEVLVDLEAGAHRQAPFLALNPFGKVPVLEQDGYVLYESEAITEYLEENYPDYAMLPNDTRERAYLRQVIQVHDHYLAPQVHALLRQYFFTKPGARDEGLIAETFRQVQKVLAWLDNQLAGREYFGGPLFTLADAAYVHNLLNLLPQFNVTMDGRPHITAWINRVSQRPSVVKTNPGLFRKPQGKKQPEYLHRKTA